LTKAVRAVSTLERTIKLARLCQPEIPSISQSDARNYVQHEIPPDEKINSGIGNIAVLPTVLIAASPATLTIAGTFALLFALFSPLVTIPMLGSINYTKLGWQWVVLVLLISAAVTITLLKKYHLLWIVAALAAGLVSYTFTFIQLSLMDLHHLGEPSVTDDPGTSLGKIFTAVFTASSGLDWAWPIVIAGVALLYSAWLITKWQEINQKRKKSAVVTSCFAVFVPLIFGTVAGQVDYNHQKNQFSGKSSESSVPSPQTNDNGSDGDLPKASANSSQEADNTALTTAAGISDYDKVSFLINKGADINTADKDGFTPLDYASLPGDSKMVTLLLSRGANPDLKDNNGDTALFEALTLNPDTDGQYKTVQQLLGYKADVNSKNNDGKTPLMCAASDDNVSIIKLMIATGADVNAKSDSGMTALQEASLNSDPNVMDVLRNAGARE
jgi:hypothetical protein